MHPALWISKTGLEAQQLDVSVISNNLANVNTIGFKKGRAVFEDLLYQNFKQPGGQSSQDSEYPSGMMLGTGVAPMATQKTFTQGNLINTDNPLDIAINGNGFFQIQRPDGSISYTRDGQFQVDSTGRVVTASGYPLLPTMTIPQNALSVSISNDGIVSITVPNSSSLQQLGQIQIADFLNPTGLTPIGENQYIESNASGNPTVSNPAINGFGSLTQSSLETSNVNVVEELVKLIETQRAYEMNARSIETVDDMMQFVSQKL